VVLLRGHGNAVVGPNVRMAVYRAVYTEVNAKLLLQAKMLGGPINYLAPEEAAIMEQSRERPGHGTDRIWELLKSEAIAHTGRPRRCSSAAHPEFREMRPIPPAPSASRHPPKPRLTLRVGITGHRPNKLYGAAVARIARQLPAVFATIERTAARILKDNESL